VIDEEITGTTEAQPGVQRHWLASFYPLVTDHGDTAGVICAVLEVTRDRQAAAQLRDSEERARLLFRDAPVPMFLFDVETLRFLDVNAVAIRAYGWSYDEFLAMTLRDIRPPDEQPRLDATLATNRPEGISHTRTRHTTKQGTIINVEVSSQSTEYRGRPARVAMVMDVSERLRAEAVQRELEERLRQSQKMEAVGQLAGGIAHDFNNLLTVIGGNLDFVSRGLPEETPVRADLDEIAAAAHRAQTLVRQLLTFSRKQRVNPEHIQVGEVVQSMQQLLRRVIGEEITMDVLVRDELGYVCIDRGQLEQVVMNLVVNARYAMLTPAFGTEGTGGLLSIEVRAEAATAERAECVALIVRDTGHGMDEQTRAHLFEPFFTTKDVGVGTGLGLATVHGIVQQAQGVVSMESAPGRGSTFTVLLPVVEPMTPVVGPAVVPTSAHMLAGVTLLIAEDEAPVRTILRRMLEHHGAHVLEARHGRDALALWAEHRATIRAVVTDLRMPELGGRALVEALRADGTMVPALYVSGYAAGADKATLGPYDQFVEKPFTTESLLGALQRLLVQTA
jgi:hypothetical protein